MEHASETTSHEERNEVAESIKELEEASLQAIADIDTALQQALEEETMVPVVEQEKVLDTAHKAREAIYYYTRLIIMAGLALSQGGDVVSSRSRETVSERLARAKIELKSRGITSEQRRTYKPLFSEAIYRGVNPAAYDVEFKAKQFIPTFLKGREIWDPKREDAWRLYLGLQQEHSTFEISDYRPSHGKEDRYYYKIADFWEHLFANRVVFEPYYGPMESEILHQEYRPKKNARECIQEIVETVQKGGHYKATDDVALIMGQYKMDAGEDELGHYISYYDSWNLDIPLESEGLVGTPFEIYDRLYFDPATFEPIALNQSKLKEEIDRNRKLKEEAASALPG